MDKHTEPSHTAPTSTVPAACRSARIRIIVSLARTFTREQAAYLIAQALRMADSTEVAEQSASAHAWGRGFLAGREHVAELNLAALHAGINARPFSEAALRREGYRMTARREADMAAAFPWRTDHPGGSVPEWADDPVVRERAEALTARLRRLPDIRR